MSNDVTTNFSQLQALFIQLHVKTIGYSKAYYTLTKSFPAAILLSHLLYLYVNHFGCKEFYQSDNQLMESLGFSIKVLRKAKTKIEKYVIKTRKGVDGKNHWTVLMDAIAADLLQSKVPSEIKADTEVVEDEDLGSAQMGTSGSAQTGTTKNKDLKNEYNNNNSEPKPRKYRHAPALAEGDVVVAKILEKAAAFELPQQSIQKVIKKHGRGAVDAALDLLAKQENINSIKNLMGWVTDAAREGWAFEEPKAQPAVVSPTIEVERYISEHRDTKLHKDALAALEREEGIKPPMGIDYKDKEYEIFFNDEYKFNVKLVDKMKELKAKK